jgi:multicomponent Na+:H+ antiporter subunit F
MMFAAAALALLVTLALALARTALGPTLFDRALGANSVGTVAIVYGLLNVIGTIAVLKYFRQGDLGDPGIDQEAAK